MTSFYTAQQAAQRLGVTVRRVRALCESGRIEAQRFGKSWMIPEAALDEYTPRKAGRPPKAK